MFVANWVAWILGSMAVVLLVILGVSVWMAYEYYSLRGHFNPTDDLVGELGTVRKECTAHQRGKVYVAGAYWDAISEHGVLHVGEDIKVADVRERFLVVGKADLIGRNGQMNSN